MLKSDHPPEATLIVCIVIPSFRGVSDGIGVPSTRNKNVFGRMLRERSASDTVPIASTSIFFPYIVITTLTTVYIYTLLIVFTIIVFIKRALFLQDESSASDGLVVSDVRYRCDCNSR